MAARGTARRTVKAMATVICIFVVAVISVIFQLWSISVMSVIFHATDQGEILEWGGIKRLYVPAILGYL